MRDTLGREPSWDEIVIMLNKRDARLWRREHIWSCTLWASV
jgi:hypothetical protein